MYSVLIGLFSSRNSTIKGTCSQTSDSRSDELILITLLRLGLVIPASQAWSFWPVASSMAQIGFPLALFFVEAFHLHRSCLRIHDHNCAAGFHFHSGWCMLAIIICSSTASTHCFDQVDVAVTCNVLAFEHKNFRLETSFVVSPRTWQVLISYYSNIFTRRPVLVYGEVYLSITVFTNVWTSRILPTLNPDIYDLCYWYSYQPLIVLIFELFSRYMPDSTNNETCKYWSSTRSWNLPQMSMFKQFANSKIFMDKGWPGSCYWWYKGCYRTRWKVFEDY